MQLIQWPLNLLTCFYRIISDKDGAPQLSLAHSAASAEWKRPSGELPLVDFEIPDEIVQDVVSDCSVIAALGVCAEHRQRFGSCVRCSWSVARRV
jgi:calpain-7